MNERDKYWHSSEIDMALCVGVMKSTQTLVKAIELLCRPRLKIIEIVQARMVLKGPVNGLETSYSLVNRRKLRVH